MTHQPPMSDAQSVALMMSYAKTHTTLDEKNETIEKGGSVIANSYDEKFLHRDDRNGSGGKNRMFSGQVRLKN